MATAQANDVTIEYDTFGSPDDPALLLVMGFTAQMTAWRDDFCTMLADRGRYVIRHDNRDCGLSAKFDGVQVDMMAAMQAAQAKQPFADAPYTLSDMAADGIGLLDHLGIDRAHVLGASMGGMIVQTMAIEHPRRLRSMTSVMSTIGDLDYGKPDPGAMQVLLTPPPADREGVIEAATRAAVFSSKRYYDPELSKAYAATAYDRSFYPEGAPRQLAAIYASGDRTAQLRDVSVPTLVIHGRDDTLINPSGGIRTAELIPTASLLLLADMGHDLPQPLWPVIVDAVISHTTYAG
ncbi:MAG: alpha/beta hydrolase [Ilumatobacteraceae bacterium]